MSENKPSNPFTVFLTAVQFLLISPAFIKRPFTPQELGAGTAYYPLVGAILGGLLCAADVALGRLFPPAPTSALILALGVLLTGALHLDGFLDSCDGLLGGFTPEQRLEIMRDERVGAYALAGGALILLLQYSALSSLAGSERWSALLLAPILGRMGMALAVAAFPYARPTGLGRDIKDHARPPQAAAALLTGLAATGAVYWATHSLAALLAFPFALLAWFLAARFILDRIPGLTGDSYGAINVLVESTVLLVFAANI